MVSYWDNDEILRYASLNFFREFNINGEKKNDALTLRDLLKSLYDNHEPYLKSVLTGNPKVFEQDFSQITNKLGLCIVTYYPDWDGALLIGFYLHVFEKPAINLHDPDLMMAINKFNNLLVNSVDYSQANEQIRVVDPQMEKIAEYLKSIILDKFPGLPQIAEIHFMSVSKLKRDFKIAYGVSPFMYYRKLQMDIADQYLKEKKYRIGELATIFNFSNPYNFTSCYNRFKDKSIALKPIYSLLQMILITIFEFAL